jgi:hypothetical protein
MNINKILTTIKTKLNFIFSKFGLYSKTAVTITQSLKTVVENNLTADIVKATPMVWDDLGLEALKIHVPKVALKIALIHEILEANESANPLEIIVLYLKQLKPEARTDFWIRFSAELTRSLADDKLSLSEAIILSQMAFKELYEKPKMA